MRPTIFVLDDAHLDFDLLERVVGRLQPLLRQRAIRLVVTAQAQRSEPGALQETVVDLIEECEEDGQVLWLDPTIEQYAAIASRAAPHLRDLAPSRLARLYQMTARDLVLLDAALTAVADAAELDTLEETALFGKALRRYFGGQIVHAPRLKALAAIAQFDLAVPISRLEQPLEPSYSQAVRRLTVAVGPPAGVTFIHASAAELVFRALCWSDGDSSWMEVAQRSLVGFFSAALASREGWERDLHQFLRGRLRMAPDSELKLAVLADPGLRARLAERRATLPLNSLSLMTFLTRAASEPLPYADWLVERIAATGLGEGTAPLGMGMLGLAFRNLALHGGGLVEELEAKLPPDRLLSLVVAHSTLTGLSSFLRYTSENFSLRLLQAMSEEQADQLCLQTIAQRKPIGNLSLSLHFLQERVPSHGSAGSQLDLLEEKIRPEGILGLVMAQGSLVDLLKILELSGEQFSAQLLELIDNAQMDQLIERALARNRSVRTLSLRLRELGSRKWREGSEQTQLEIIEEKIRPERMFQLIMRQGSLIDLLKILEYSTEQFSADLLACLGDDQVDKLLDRALSANHSVGTLSLFLRALRSRRSSEDLEQTQLEIFEERLGPERLLRLLAPHGSFIDFARILQVSTAGFGAKLLRAIDVEQLDRWLGKTLEDRDSIGTLNLALRTLEKRRMGANETRSQREALEDLVGSRRWWQLILGNGDLNDLAYLLDDMSPGFRSGLLTPQEAPDVTGWATLIRRGNFYALCRFVRDSVPYLDAEVVGRLRDAITGNAADMFKNPDWFGLSSGLAILPEVTDPAVRELLRGQADRFLASVAISDLTFDSFSPAVNAMHCLWYQRPECRAELSERLWTLLPPVEDWGDDQRVLVSARFLLTMACSPEIASADACRLLAAFCPLGDRMSLAKTYTRPLFLFLWNLFALWLQRCRGLTSQFSELQQEETWSQLVAILDERCRKRLSTEDKLDLLALAGVLVSLVPQVRSAVQAAVQGRIRGARYLLEAADELTFVPAFFTLQGLGLISAPTQNFTRERCEKLLARAADYEERGPAIQLLCEAVRRWGGIR